MNVVLIDNTKFKLYSFGKNLSIMINLIIAI